MFVCDKETINLRDIIMASKQWSLYKWGLLNEVLFKGKIIVDWIKLLI